ncbi:OTU domain-containing protein OS=Streptomyces fumanus OX=67302 GN=GCM10018772_56770 PE=4 SV=1 [Streptomyces fumanus]
MQSHSGATSALRGALTLSAGIGLGAGPLQVVKVGLGLAGTLNASARATTRTSDAEGGQVEVSADTSAPVAYAAHWTVRLRTDPARRWEETEPVPVEPADGRRRRPA